MKQPHWLDQYASNYHEWHQAQNDGKNCFYRPLGIVETAFDSDGIYYEGTESGCGLAWVRASAFNMVATGSLDFLVNSGAATP